MNRRKFLRRALLNGKIFLKKQKSRNSKKKFTFSNNTNLPRPIIALDAMGGDFAPQETVKGAIKAAREEQISIQLVGDTHRIHRELTKYETQGLPIEVIDAQEIISMEDKNPAQSIRKRKDASIAIACKQVVSGEADAVVSAGSTGASVSASLLILKRINGIQRPGIALIVPSIKKESILIDAGANVDSTPFQIAQHAVMGSLFASQTLGLQSPSVGLLNIGEESGKGNQLNKETFDCLNKLELINFVGNVESKTLYKNFCDVIVTDGFIGNVFLKTVESSMKTVFLALHDQLTKNSGAAKLGALLCKESFRNIKSLFNPEKYGGGILLGVQGVSIIAHGSSGGFAIKNAIALAKESVESKIISNIQEALSKSQKDKLK